MEPPAAGGGGEGGGEGGGGEGGGAKPAAKPAGAVNLAAEASPVEPPAAGSTLSHEGGGGAPAALEQGRMLPWQVTDSEGRAARVAEQLQEASARFVPCHKPPESSCTKQQNFLFKHEKNGAFVAAYDAEFAERRPCASTPNAPLPPLHRCTNVVPLRAQITPSLPDLENRIIFHRGRIIIMQASVGCPQSRCVQCPSPPCRENLTNILATSPARVRSST